MVAIDIILPLPPSTNRLWVQTKNRKTGKRGVALSPEYSAWKYEAGWMMGKLSPIKGRFSARLEAARVSRRDLDNTMKGVLDALQWMGVIENDNLADEIVLRWVDPDDKRYPGKGLMRITIHAMA